MDESFEVAISVAVHRASNHPPEGRAAFFAACLAFQLQDLNLALSQAVETLLIQEEAPR